MKAMRWRELKSTCDYDRHWMYAKNFNACMQYIWHEKKRHLYVNKIVSCEEWRFDNKKKRQKIHSRYKTTRFKRKFSIPCVKNLMIIQKIKYRRRFFSTHTSVLLKSKRKAKISQKSVSGSNIKKNVSLLLLFYILFYFFKNVCAQSAV